MGVTPLYLAVDNNHYGACKLLLTCGADANANVKLYDYYYKSTLLHIAVRHGNIDICELLMDHGADISKTEDYKTPLQIAAKENHEDICKLFLRYDIGDAIDMGYPTPLYHAIDNNNTELAKLFIQHGASIGACKEVHYADNGAHFNEFTDTLLDVMSDLLREHIPTV